MTDKIEVPPCFIRLVAAAKGLSRGSDWNNGTHAKSHGYRQKLLDALNECDALLREARAERLAEPAAAIVREHDGRAFAVLRDAGADLPHGTELYAAQPEPITPKQLARLIADNPDVQFSVKSRPADEELRRDAERMKFASEAPNLHGQVYLSCRLRGAAHQQALDLAHDAEKMYGPEQVSEADLHTILEEISDAIADEEKENSND